MIVGLGVGVCDVGVGVGRALCVGAGPPAGEVVPGAGRALLVACPLWDGLALGLGLPLGVAALGLGNGPAEGVVAPAAWVAVVLAAWLNRFMNPTTPTALSRLARQVKVDSLRKPLSRCARRRSRCLMAATKSDHALRGHQERLKAAFWL